jgi:DNA-binding transcriptional MerR regulator
MLVERIEQMLDQGRSVQEIQRTLESEGKHSRGEIIAALRQAESIDADLDELEQLFREEDERHAHDQRVISPEEQRRGD